MTLTKTEIKLKMARLKVKYQEIGFVEFPRELISSYCPKNYTPIQVHEWFISANNVWLLRNGNEQMISMYEKVYNKAKDDIDNMYIDSEQVK